MTRRHPNAVRAHRLNDGDVERAGFPVGDATTPELARRPVQCWTVLDSPVALYRKHTHSTYWIMYRAVVMSRGLLSVAGLWWDMTDAGQAVHPVRSRGRWTVQRAKTRVTGRCFSSTVQCSTFFQCSVEG